MKRSNRPRHAGFSLVELMIVIAVIGLLLGAILLGQELVASGRGKAVVIELNQLNGAVAAYRDRYRALPGDDPLAQSRWGLTAIPAATPSSPGNGSIDGAYNVAAAVPEAESRLFWWHLRRAGFLSGAADAANPALAGQQPQNAVGGMTGVTNGVGALTVGLAGPIVCTANVPGRIAAAVDLQIDDGAPANGALRAKRQTASNEDIGAAADAYVEDAGLYLLCRTLP